MDYQSDIADLKDNISGIMQEGVLEILVALNCRPFLSDDLSVFFGFSEEKTTESVDFLKNILAIRDSKNNFIITKLGSALNYYLKAVFEDISSEKINLTSPDAENINKSSVILRRHFELYINESNIDDFTGALMTPGQRPTDNSDLNNFFGIITLLSLYSEFFGFHNYSLLPEFALHSIGKIRHASLTCDPPVDFSQGFSIYLEILKEAEHIHGISTWENPGITSTILERVRKGAETGIIISEELAFILIDSPDFQHLEDYNRYDNLKLYVTKERIPVGLTVTDKKLSLGFFLNDKNTYDSIHDFVSSSEESLEWGEELYEYYRKRSVSLDEYCLP